MISLYHSFQSLFKYCICVILSVVTRSRRSPRLSFHACSCLSLGEKMMAGSLAYLPSFKQESHSLFVLEISVQSLCNLLALVNRYGSKNNLSLPFAIVLSLALRRIFQQRRWFLDLSFLVWAIRQCYHQSHAPAMYLQITSKVIAPLSKMFRWSSPLTDSLLLSISVKGFLHLLSRAFLLPMIIINLTHYVRNFWIGPARMCGKPISHLFPRVLVEDWRSKHIHSNLSQFPNLERDWSCSGRITRARGLFSPSQCRIWCCRPERICVCLGCHMYLRLFSWV